jgi:hypothetical protein
LGAKPLRPKPLPKFSASKGLTGFRRLAALAVLSALLLAASQENSRAQLQNANINGAFLQELTGHMDSVEGRVELGPNGTVTVYGFKNLPGALTELSPNFGDGGVQAAAT